MSTILPPRDLTGRLLMLNEEKIKKFQCGGFYLGPNIPFSVVTSAAQMDPLYYAVLDGRLIDITDQNISGLKTTNVDLSAASEQDTDKTVFMGTDSEGRPVIIIPKDKEEEARFRSEIAATGKIQSAAPEVIGPSKVTSVDKVDEPKIIVVE